MRLTALRARFISDVGRQCMGITFDCPKHPAVEGDVVLLWFENPVGGGEPCTRRPRFYRFGDDIETLTLGPSKGDIFEPLRLPHWRGWVYEGEAVSAR